MIKDRWYESGKCDLAHIKNAPGRFVFFRVILSNVNKRF